MNHRRQLLRAGFMAGSYEHSITVSSHPVKVKRENINNPTRAEMGLILQRFCCASPGPALLLDAFMEELFPFPAGVHWCLQLAMGEKQQRRPRDGEQNLGFWLCCKRGVCFVPVGFWGEDGDGVRIVAQQC